MKFSDRINGQNQALLKIAHILFLVALIPLLGTGLAIAQSNGVKLGFAGYILPQGAMHFWHLTFATVLIFAISLYSIRLINISVLPKLNWQTQNTVEWLFRLTHYIGLALLIASLLTGVALVFDAKIIKKMTLVTLHLSSALSFIGYLVIHSALAFSARPWRFISVFLFRHKKPALPALLFCTIALLAPIVFQWQIQLTDKSLTLTFTTEKIDLDGESREGIWQNTPTKTIQTYQGYAQPKKGTEVSVQAAHDGEYAYFYLKWFDDTRSQKHLPMVKTNEGWKILQTNAKTADENKYYEDKLAIMLSTSNQLAGAGTVHLGSKPLKDHPAPSSKRGLHYTNDNALTDVWHWKSVRTGNSIGQADDNHFGTPQPSTSEYKRYTGGYQKDLDDCEHLVRWDGSDFQTKPECGGFVENWVFYEDDVVQPKRLPASQSTLDKMGEINLDENVSDFGRWWMPWEETIAYHPDEDEHPIGTVMPSVLSLGPFTQGRGDVSAVAQWQANYWMLEIKRKLDVSSEYDLPVKTGMYFWVAVFNHSQTRHSYHLKPLRIELSN